MSLQRQSKDGDDAVHGLVLPSDCARAVSSVVPEAGRRRVKTGAILLHDVASDDVFEGLVQLRQVVETVLNDVRRPLVDLWLLVGISPDRVLYGIFDDGADLYYYCYQ